MRIMVSSLLVLLCASMGLAQMTVQMKEVTIDGLRITLGMEAHKVQDRIRAYRFYTSGHNYSDTSTGYYYGDKGRTYIITYGPSYGMQKGPHVVVAIERFK